MTKKLNSKQPKPDKVAIRREKEIKEAIERGDWKRVVHLLSLPFDNAERKDRYHGKLSLNFIYKRKEMLDFLPDNSRHSNPLESLIYEEDTKIVYQTIDEFDDIEQIIIFGYFFEDKNFTQLAEEVHLSDKTVKRRLEKSLKLLREKLEE
ncbi:hypothetical protein SORDD05_01252 [Streptococcus oralis]|uniref:RNA polymerase sigma-70 region 4 domain-containing protein n=1 Tax=Streptococcus oralis TaxID=1303 RepID=A0A139M7J2_STROR|nr:sigma-70 family RNA polymerase sigma factor [Streptococcus oralis]KXT59745.1 hypothetical protein SORDD05_01252 [Streptococcus oralis]